MYDQLYAHVNPLLSPAQSGFRKGDSTAWQLARFTQNLLERRHQHNFSLVCFFDLSKAFDTVWHRGLLAKVATFNIGGNVLRWLESYLSCRVQQVRVSGSLSQPLEVCSGVPQGSILGPLLFLLYVNDLTRVPNTSLYADDTTLVASELSLPMACNSLQSEIRSVVEWMRLWKLRPNAGKTVILCIPLP
eukprot:scpid43917/ scgid10550/ Probable RNA-directed DNA polymerase from transposon BS; Reverse transcriptase